MHNWGFDRDVTKELITACWAAGIPFTTMHEGGLPSDTTIRYWRKTDRAFDAALHDVRRPKPKRGNWDEARLLLVQGHSAASLERQFPAMPSPRAIAKHAKANPEWYVPVRRVQTEKAQEVVRRRNDRKSGILRRLAGGETLADLMRDRFINRTLLDKWRASDREFDHAIRAIITTRTTEENERRMAAAEAERTRRLVRKEEARQRRLAEADAAVDPVYSAADKAVPRTYPKDVRDDVISSIFLAVIEGEIDAREIPTKAKQFVSAYWRGRPEFHALSFDAPVGHSGGRLTLHEIIAQS